MAHEQQQPMSEARLAEITRRAWGQSPISIMPLGDHVAHWIGEARDDRRLLLAEVERLRAREAALVAIAVEVARLDTEAGNGIGCRCRLSVPFGHLDDCWVLEAQVIAHTTSDGEMDG